MNIPLTRLNRDELYTFIVGLFTGSAWQFYLQEIGIIAKNTGVIDSTLLFSWLFATGLVYIFYAILMEVVNLDSRRKTKHQNDDEELKKLNLIKYRSFFWSGPLEEQHLQRHIWGLFTTSLLFVYHPTLSFISSKVSLPWFIVIHVAYTGITIAAYLMCSGVDHYLHKVKHFLDKNYCDTLDQATYLRERAVFYAKIKNEEFLLKQSDQAR